MDDTMGGLRWRTALLYPGPGGGMVAGAVVANVMFSQPAITISTHHRASPGHFLSEVVATAGLLLVIFALVRTGRAATAAAPVGAYIGAAYFFTSSTSFANPAITIGRMFSNTSPASPLSSVPSFTAAQLVGALVGLPVIRLLYPGLTAAEARTVIVPQPANADTDQVPAPQKTP